MTSSSGIHEMQGDFVIQAGESGDTVKTCSMISKDGSKYMFNVAAIPERYKNQMSELFVLDSKDLRIVEDVIQTKGVKKAVEILKDLKTFCKTYPKKQIYLREAHFKKFKNPVLFPDEVLSALDILSTNKEIIISCREKWKQEDDRNMTLVELTELRPLFNELGIKKSRVTIIPDFIAYQSRKLAWHSSTIDPIYTYAPDGQKVVHVQQTAFHITRLFLCGVPKQSALCENISKCAWFYAMIKNWVKQMMEGPNCFVRFSKFSDIINTLKKELCPVHKSSHTVVRDFSDYCSDDEIQIEEYQKTCESYGIQSYKNFLVEPCQVEEDSIPVWVARVQMTAASIQNLNFSSVVGDNLRKELKISQPTKGVTLAIGMFLDRLSKRNIFRTFFLLVVVVFTMLLCMIFFMFVLLFQKIRSFFWKKPLENNEENNHIMTLQLWANYLFSVIFEMYSPICEEIEEDYYGVDSEEGAYLKSSEILKYLKIGKDQSLMSSEASESTKLEVSKLAASSESLSMIPKTTSTASQTSESAFEILRPTSSENASEVQTSSESTQTPPDSIENELKTVKNLLEESRRREKKMEEKLKAKHQELEKLKKTFNQVSKSSESQKNAEVQKNLSKKEWNDLETKLKLTSSKLLQSKEALETSESQVEILKENVKNLEKNLEDVTDSGARFRRANDILISKVGQQQAEIEKLKDSEKLLIAQTLEQAEEIQSLENMLDFENIRNFREILNEKIEETEKLERENEGLKTKIEKLEIDKENRENLRHQEPQFRNRRQDY